MSAPVLLGLLFFCSSVCFGKVYDCFPFFNELELLKLRLHELNDTVDYFVLVESIETQRGDPKKLFFEENKELFAPFLHKIKHVKILERHPEFGLWERENYQRNCIIRALGDCKRHDLILISDLDEIPRKELIPKVRPFLKEKQIPAVTFSMDLFRFQLNRKDPNYSSWSGTVALTYKSLCRKTPQYYRDKRDKWQAFSNAGWHFTWMGGRDFIRTKLKSVVEGMENADTLSDEDVDKWMQTVPIVPLDDSFPAYVLKHTDELKSIGMLAD